tara:strand:- start:3777 stop:4532 length:756 start_codon:yes stop_codon:yes gene_type:complete
MNAIIVAAGMSKRLREFTADRPKCMVDINGKSLFDWQTETLSKSGISKINVVVGYKKEWFMNNEYHYFENKDFQNNNILHSLFYAEKAMDSGFLFSYSDIIYEGNIVKQMLSSAADIAVAADTSWISHYEGRIEHPIEEAELLFSEDGKTVSLIRKNADHEKAFGEFIGMAFFSERGAKVLISVFSELKEYYAKNPAKSFHTAKTFKQAYMTDMIQELVNRGYLVDIVGVSGRWAEIDTSWDLEVVRKKWK